MNFNFKGFGKNNTTSNMNNLTFSTPKTNTDNLTFGSLSSPNLNTSGFNGSVIKQSDLNPSAFRGSIIQQSDLDNPQKLTFKDRWNAIPQEKKSAFAQAMADSTPQFETQATIPIELPMQDYSWVFQPTRGSLING